MNDEEQGAAAPETTTDAIATVAEFAAADPTAVDKIDAGEVAKGLQPLVDAGAELAANDVNDGLDFAAAAAADGPAINGTAAWAASLRALAPSTTAESAAAWVTNCLRDGYAQGQSATLGPDVMADHAVQLTARVADLEKQLAARGVEPAPHESLVERIEDEIIHVAEEAAYAVSNRLAPEHNRKPDDGIDAWRKRTGGLHRHPAVAVKADA